MDHVLANCAQFCSVYIDDIIFYSRTLDEHFEHLEQVAKTLKDHGIVLSKKKAVFCKNKMEFLGC